MPADVQPVAVGQAPVEHQKVITMKLDQLLRFRNLRGFVAGQSRPRQRSEHQGAQPLVILDDQSPHGSCAFTWEIVTSCRFTVFNY